MPNAARLALVALLVLICLLWPRAMASQEGAALDCPPGARHTLTGAGAPSAAGLLLTFDARAIGGGVSDSAGRWAIPLTVGDERPGVYVVAVSVRGGAQLASWRCEVPDPFGAQPTQRAQATPTGQAGRPTATPIPVFTVAPTRTGQATATPTLPPASFSGDCADPITSTATSNYPVQITNIDKDAEIVTLENLSSATINLEGWVLCSVLAGQRHEPLDGTLAPGESREFVYEFADDQPIWNNSERDPGALYNPQGQLVSYWPD